MTYEDQVDFVRNLKGAAASILWILLLSGRSLTARQLEEATGYSDKPITRALRWLEARHYVQNNGRLHGWSLGRAIQPHLPFPPELPPSKNGSTPALPANSEFRTPNSEFQYAPIHRSPIHPTDRENPDRPDRINPDLSEKTDRNNSELSPADHIRNPQSQIRNRNISDLQSEKLRSPNQDLIYSVTVPDLTDNKNNHQPDQTKTDQDPQPRKNSDHATPDNMLPACFETQTANSFAGPTATNSTTHSPNPQSAIPNPQLATFLHRIQMRSPALDRILARDNLPEVLAWYWESLGQEWMDNPNGWIVRRLDSGESPLPAYLEFASAWLTMTGQELEDYYAAGCRPYGLQDYWRDCDLSRDAIAAHDIIKKAGGLDLFDDFPRPIIPAISRQPAADS